MGVAIIIPNVSFADANLGKVTLTGNVPVRALAIVSPDSISGTTYQLLVSYNPTNTNQRDVVWAIESGSDYATIDGSTGLLTIKSNAYNSDVKVRVTSNSNASINDVKTIKVTYVQGEVRRYVLSGTASADNALTSEILFEKGSGGTETLAYKNVGRLHSTTFIPVNKIKKVVCNGVRQSTFSVVYFSDKNYDSFISAEWPNVGAEDLGVANWAVFDRNLTIPDGAKYAIICCNTSSSLPARDYYIEIYGEL